MSTNEITSQGPTTSSFRAEVTTVGLGTTKRPTFLSAWQKAISSQACKLSAKPPVAIYDSRVQNRKHLPTQRMRRATLTADQWIMRAHHWIGRSNSKTQPNAKRAVEQLAAGEQPGGGGLIGWDYNFQNDPFAPNRYTLELEAGDFVSATLVWDRDILLNSPFLEYQPGDEFIDFGFADLNLYLVPAGFGIEEAVAESTSTEWNLEHIFADVPADGVYQLWVTTDETNDIFYAIAWWAGPDERGAPGNFSKDGSVDAADYVA